MTQPTTELTSPPVVGQFYLVPHIQMDRHDCGTKKQFIIWMAAAPILGPLHEDADIGVKDYHWHFDWRFMPRSIWEEWFEERGRHPLGLVLNREYTTGEIVFKRRKCLREIPEYPVTLAAQFLAKFEEKYSEHQLNCWTCPHRGLPLNGLPTKNGFVTCPGHGLRWDVSAIAQQTGGAA